MMILRPLLIASLPLIALLPSISKPVFAAESNAPPDDSTIARHGNLLLRIPANWSSLPQASAEPGAVGWTRQPGAGTINARLTLLLWPAPRVFTSSEKLDALLKTIEEEGLLANAKPLSHEYFQIAGRRTLRITESAKAKSFRHYFVVVDGLRLYVLCCLTEGLDASALEYFEPMLCSLSIIAQLPTEQLVLDTLAAREACLKDYRDMLLRFANDAVAEQFKAWDEDLWPKATPQSGWAYFFKTSLIVYGCASAEGARVSFYQPWCDVALVTDWKLGETCTMTHVEVWPGDAVRKSLRPPFKPTPGWKALDLYRPVAVLRNASDTCRKLESLQTMPSQVSDRTRRAGVAGSAIAMTLHNLQLTGFLQSNETLPLRRLVADASHKMKDGAFGEWLAGLPDLTDAWRESLAKMPAKTWNRLRPSGFLWDDQTAVLLMAREDAPQQFASFLFRKNDETWRVTDFRYYAFSVAFPEMQLRMELEP